MQDAQLEIETRELYILSRHLVSDINFSEGEIKFLANMFHKYLIPAPNAALLVKAGKLENEIAQIDNHIPGLKNKVSELSKCIDPLINKQDKVIGMDLLEHFFSLETEIKLLFESVMAFKTLLFGFVDEVLKAERHDLLSII